MTLKLVRLSIAVLLALLALDCVASAQTGRNPFAIAGGEFRRGRHRPNGDDSRLAKQVSHGVAGRGEGAENQRFGLLDPGRSEFRLWRVPRRRARSWQGGAGLIHDRQRNRAAARNGSRRPGRPAPGLRRDRAGVGRGQAAGRHRPANAGSGERHRARQLWSHRVAGRCSRLEKRRGLLGGPAAAAHRRDERRRFLLRGGRTPRTFIPRVAATCAPPTRRRWSAAFSGRARWGRSSRRGCAPVRAPY